MLVPEAPPVEPVTGVLSPRAIALKVAFPRSGQRRNRSVQGYLANSLAKRYKWHLVF